MKFNSIPEAIDNQGSYLKRMYFDQGQTTLPAIRDGWNGKQWNPDIGHTPFYPSTHRAASLNPIAQRGAGCPPAGRQAASKRKFQSFTACAILTPGCPPR